MYFKCMYYTLFFIIFALILFLYFRWRHQTYIPRVNFRYLNREKFIEYITSDKPVIFYNTIQHTIDFSEFCDKLGDKTIKVRTGNYGTTEGVHTRKFHETTVKSYCAHLTDPDYNGYGGNNVVSDSELKKLNIVPNSNFLSKFPGGKLWIGKSGSRTPLHKDEPHNLALQLYGTKQWIIYDAKDVPNLCYDLENKQLEWSKYSIGDYNTCKTAQKATPITLTLKPGDMLYLPKLWSHDVTNLTNSIMINFWYKKLL